MTDLGNPASRAQLAALYRSNLVDDVMPFWLRHGIDRENGGICTTLDRDGSLLDTDKSLWFQGRAGWMFATLFNRLEPRREWLEAAKSCVEFSRKHGCSPEGKMWFTVTREGMPLRMRRYVFSESFAAISYSAYATAARESRAADEALIAWETYLRFSFEPGLMQPKYEATRPMKGIGPLMIGIVTAQELRTHLGEVGVRGRTFSEWIASFIGEIERDFFKPDLAALMENVSPDGGIVDHLDGRTLNPGHAIEAAWFIMQEGRHLGDASLITLGTRILDCMWQRGWDAEHGGLLYFTDLHHKPVQEYWQDMKFWWPHCEGIIATLLAWRLTGHARYAEMHRLIHDWSFAHFPDREHGEWFGYLHRDGTVAQTAKGNMFKGPFHLPRMLWFCHNELVNDLPTT